MTPPTSSAPATDKPLTRFRIFESWDGGQTFTYVADELALGSDEALKKHYPDPPAVPDAKVYFAVSENYSKFKRRKARVTTEDADVNPASFSNQAPIKEDEEGRAVLDAEGALA